MLEEYGTMMDDFCRECVYEGKWKDIQDISQASGRKASILIYISTRCIAKRQLNIHSTVNTVPSELFCLYTKIFAKPQQGLWCKTTMKSYTHFSQKNDAIACHWALVDRQRHHSGHNLHCCCFLTITVTLTLAPLPSPCCTNKPIRFGPVHILICQWCCWCPSLW